MGSYGQVSRMGAAQSGSCVRKMMLGAVWKQLEGGKPEVGGPWRKPVVVMAVGTE